MWGQIQLKSKKTFQATILIVDTPSPITGRTYIRKEVVSAFLKYPVFEGHTTKGRPHQDASREDLGQFPPRNFHNDSNKSEPCLDFNSISHAVKEFDLDPVTGALTATCEWLKTPQSVLAQTLLNQGVNLYLMPLMSGMLMHNHVYDMKYLGVDISMRDDSIQYD